MHPSTSSFDAFHLLRTTLSLSNGSLRDYVKELLFLIRAIGVDLVGNLPILFGKKSYVELLGIILNNNRPGPNNFLKMNSLIVFAVCGVGPQ